MDSETDGHARTQYFALNYWLKKERIELGNTLLFIDYDEVFDNIKRHTLFNILKSW